MPSIRAKTHDFFLNIWYGKSRFMYLLYPITGLYCMVVTVRLVLYKLNILKSQAFDVPVVVIGNITVGGTGKTPLVIWLANYLKDSGYRPGIISRGYLGKAQSWPQQVRPDSDPVMIGDEAIVIARRTQCPIAVGPDRVASCAALLKYHDCDIVLSDDGLQHYRLERDVEIMVVDGVRRFGNEHCLPAGPLREPVQRMEKVDFIVANGVAKTSEYAMRYTSTVIYRLLDPSDTMTLSSLKSNSVHAVAAIGNPSRFYDFLKGQGLNIVAHDFPDHYAYFAHDLDFADDKMIILTEKDAVKCQRIANDKMWVLPVDVDIKREFGIRFLEKIAQCSK